MTKVPADSQGRQAICPAAREQPQADKPNRELPKQLIEIDGRVITH